MPAISAQGPNAAQIAYWNTAAGPSWVAMQDQIDRQLRPLGLTAMDRLAPAAGETVLDVGCGCGSTTLDLAARVGPAGHILAVDISEPMLGVAEERARAAGFPQVEFRLADAQTATLLSGAADALFSRFGVMFFADPAAAFTNLRRALKPGGRRGFVCWRAMALNPWMGLPFQAAVAAFPDLAPTTAPDPFAPGPFAFADGKRLRTLLQTAGFRDIVIEPHDQLISLGDLESTLFAAVRLGPLAAAMRDNPGRQEAITAAVRAEMARHDSPQGVQLESSTWMVTASA